MIREAILALANTSDTPPLAIAFGVVTAIGLIVAIVVVATFVRAAAIMLTVFAFMKGIA